MPEAIAGLADMRGRIVTLLDLARIFGLATAGEAAGLLAVQFADPLSHLALLVPAPVHALRTDAGAGAGWSEAGAPEGASPESSALGREVILAGGVPVFLIDPEALIQHSVKRVRDSFRISA